MANHGREMDGERNHTSRLNEPFVTVRPPPIDITSLAVKGASIHYIRPEEGGGIKRYSKFADKHYINSADRGGAKIQKMLFTSYMDGYTLNSSYRDRQRDRSLLLGNFSVGNFL